MNKNQYSNECASAPASSTEESIRQAKAMIKKGLSDLGRAKVEALNQKLQELEILRADPECPRTGWAWTYNTSILIPISHDCETCRVPEMELTKRPDRA